MFQTTIEIVHENECGMRSQSLWGKGSSPFSTTKLRIIMKLYSRDSFRDLVFARDFDQCVICKNKGQDAHHIIERRLFDDGGYYLDNGVTLCGYCHRLAEATIISCEELREKAHIYRIILPDHMYDDFIYDKWGNIINPNGTRLKGELFFDESVQKILKEGNVLDQFVPYVKYPRTYHLPWSPGLTKDDRSLIDCNHFIGQDIVVTEKMDGENTTMYGDYIHARSIDSETHPSQHFVRKIHGDIKYQIPDGWRICGENVFARHALIYTMLPSFFLTFSIWDERNTCLNWDDTIEINNMLGLSHVPVLYEGKWDEKELLKIEDNMDFSFHEGYVVRLRDEFTYSNFRRSVAKYVRTSHVDSTVHNWKRQEIIPNMLMKEGVIIMAKTANRKLLNPFSGKVRAKRKDIDQLINMKKRDINNPEQHEKQLKRAQQKYNEFIILRDRFDRGEIDENGDNI